MYKSCTIYSRLFFISAFFFVFLGCKDESSSNTKKSSTSLDLKYAKGFTVNDYGDYKLLKINSPWSTSKVINRYTLVKEEVPAKYSLKHKNVIRTPIKKVVVTSTTHLPALELLGIEHSLVGFPDTQYISSTSIRQRINQGKIKDLGHNEQINIELLLELQPELVIGFGIDGNNTALETIKKSNIPVIYNADWLESTPLAKAEWIKFFGVLFDKEKQADSIFKTIERNYLEAKQLAKKSKRKPTVLCGAMHNNIWYMPGGRSSEAQLLNDANVNYLWGYTKTIGSLALNLEAVLSNAKQAELWINPSNIETLEALETQNPHYKIFEAFKTKNIYTVTKTTGETDGVLYYEMGVARPDIVLKDLIKIAHPELLENYKPFFFKPLH